MMEEQNTGILAFSEGDLLGASLWNRFPDGIVVFDKQGNCLHGNRSLERITGYSEDEWRNGSLLAELIAREDQPIAYNHWQQAAAGSTEHCELRLVHKQGHIIEAKITLLPIVEDGETIGIYGIFQDITERKRTELELRTTKEQMEAFLLNSSDAIWMIDLNDRVQQVNPAFEALFGWPAGEVVGGRLPIVPDFLAVEMEDLHRRIKAGTSVVGYETKRVRKDGSLLDVSVTLFPLRDKEGRVIGISGACRDISESKRAVEALRETKERMDAFLQNSADGIWMIDLEDRVLQVNPAFESLFGWTAEDVVGAKLPIVPYELTEEMELLHQQVKAGRSVSGYETVRQCKEGRQIHVSATLFPLYDKKGRVIGISGTCRDISERKQAEEELLEAKERLDAFLQNSADAIWMIDLEDRVLQVNPAFESLFGWSGQELAGGSLPIIPSPLAAEMERLHEQVKAGRSVSGYETVRLRKDGTRLHVSATLSPVRNKEGEVTGVSGTCRDITQNKHTREELRATKELFESIFNYTTDAVVVFDLQGRVLASNPASERMCALRDLNQNTVPQRVRQSYLEVINGRAPYLEFEWRRTLPEGRQYDLQVTVSAINNNKGDVDAILLMARDITESKKTQEMLIQTEKLSIAGQLAAGLAHEIRNPLTALKGFVQLMRLGQIEHGKYLEVMASELGRIEMIVSELLVLAKPQAITFKRKQLASILEDVMTLSSTQAILHNVEIDTDVAQDLPELECDGNQLKQVFINFIRNAIEAMPKGGRLHVEAHRQGPREVRARFRDEGIGIPPEHLARLGEPFYTTKTKGTGLGLMVSKTIIDNHGGRLEIASEQGVGTTVDVYLPIPADPA